MKSDRRGFTLVEVVLALAIGAMVIAMVFASLRLGRRAEEKGTERAETAQRIMVLSDRLTWLLSGAFPYMLDTEEGKKVLSFSGETDRVSFVTTGVDQYSEKPADRAGLKSVSIFLDSDGLKTSEKLFYDQEADEEEYVLEPNARSLEFMYLEPDLEGDEADWVDSWDPEGREFMPLAVMARISLMLGEREVQVPVVIVRLPAGGSEGYAVPLPRLR